MQNTFKPANRLSLPGYPFAELERKASEIKASGRELYDLSVGDPDLSPPKFVMDAVCEALKRDEAHLYPSSRGGADTRESVANWYQKRFGVHLDPETQVCILIGAKEGLGKLARAVVNPGDVVAVPDPCYPVYWRAGCRLIDGELKWLKLDAGNGFLPDLDELNGVKLAYLNYPNNPTGAEAPEWFLKRLSQIIDSNPDLTIAYDMAYSEVAFGERPHSILEYTDKAVEFHSISKMANATGYRVGFAAGERDRIQALIRIKEELDSGVSYPFQKALSAVLDSYTGSKPPEEIKEFMGIYARRRRKVIDVLKEKGLKVFDSDATFYVWFYVGDDELAFVQEAIKTGVLLTPGSGFGESGKGWVRASVTAPDETIDKALISLKAL